MIKGLKLEVLYLFKIIPLGIIYIFIFYLISYDNPLLFSQIPLSCISFISGSLVYFVIRKLPYRFIIIFLLLIIIFSLGENLLNIFSSENIDKFTLVIKYKFVYWNLLIGILLNEIQLKYRLGYWYISVLFTLIGISIIIQFKNLNTFDYIKFIFYLLSFSWLNIFVVNTIQSNSTFNYKKVIALLIFLFILAFNLIQNDYITFKRLESTDSSLINKGKNGYQLKNMLKIDKDNNNGKQLLFVANIENFIPNTTIPNPLYLTAQHMTKYNPSTEEFETDSLSPENDLFEPNIKNLPFYFQKTDSSIFIKELSYLNKHLVNITVYNVGMDDNEFFAPSTAFQVEKTTVNPEFKNTYKGIYKSTSLVSDWNSAYFVSNPKSLQSELIQFQENRNSYLRDFNDYTLVNNSFMKYYTAYPEGIEYNRLRELATKISTESGAQTTIDKVIAIRDYFLKPNEAGEPIYTYVKNPGIPGIPGKSKLENFVFETKKGYCAYYAGASLFLLRALGIPSRITVGFLTVDRSNKNPGWYWYYQDQAHAWVQVYFPQIGWLDFDMTVGNDETRESTQTDGTPPAEPKIAQYSIVGNIKEIKSKTKEIELLANSIVVNKKPYEIYGFNLKLDVSKCTFYNDSLKINLKDLKNDDSIFAISFHDNLLIDTLLDLDDSIMFQNLIKLRTYKVDEIYYQNKKSESKSDQENQIINSTKQKYIKYVWIVLFLFLLYMLIPIGTIIILFFQDIMTTSFRRKAYINNKATQLALHLLDHELLPNETATEMAKRMDSIYNIKYDDFKIYYQNLKFNPNVQISEIEKLFVKSYFSQTFLPKIFQSVSIKKRLLALIQTKKTIQFLLSTK